MKTVVVVEDGRVTVSVDDQQPVVVEPINGTRVGDKPTINPTPPQEPRGDTEGDSRTCRYCGVDISHRRKVAVICENPECKKRAVKEQNDRQRIKNGHKVGVGRGRRRYNEAGDFGLPEDTKHKPLTEDAPPAKTEERSKCCEATVRVEGGEDEPGPGGTRYYVCNGCGSTCDVVEVIPPFVDEYNCGACCAIGRFCRMHARLKEEGYKLPRSMGGIHS